MENLELKKMRLETLQVLNEYLDAIIMDVKIVSDFFRQDQIHKALECMSDLSEGLQIVFDAMNSIEREFDKEEFSSYLQEIVESLENEDYVLVADLLEYEIHPILINVKKDVQDFLKC